MFPFIISFFAGISTLFGFLIIFIKKNDKNKIIGRSLAFASGVMFCVSIIDLIPNSIEGLSNTYIFIFSILICLLFIVMGAVFSILIERYLPFDNNSDKLYKTGIISMSAIILHNIPEGIATFLTSSKNINLGITLAIAIGLHNIPEGISIAVPFFYSTNSKKKTFMYTFISGISELLGAVIAYLFLSNINSDIFLCLLFAFIAGIMIRVSISELLPSSKRYINILNIIVYFFIGFVFMYLSCLII